MDSCSKRDYVGRLGRHLLQQLDLAEPVNMVDHAGGGDYFTAADELSQITDQNGDNPQRDSAARFNTSRMCSPA